MGDLRSIGSSFDLTDGRHVVHFGEDTERDTPIGKVRVLINGAIAFLPKEGEEILELTEDEAHSIWVAFMKCASAARSVREKLTGHDVRRVQRGADGDYVVTHRGKTSRMRVSWLRKPRRCDECNEPVATVMFVSAELPRGHFTELCGPCMERLNEKPTGPREVTT